VSNGESEAQVVERMVALMERVARQENLEARAAEIGLTPYEVFIIASLIEREAKVEEDRAKISAVIRNRLFVSMNLEIDATLYYGQDPDTSFTVLRNIDSPVQHLHVPGAATDADRQPRPGVDPRCAQPGAATAAERSDVSGARRSHPVLLLLLRAGRHRRPPRVRAHLRAASPQHRDLSRSRRPVTVAVTANTQVAAVIGDPVRHSLSPVIHGAAFRSGGLDWVMVAFEVAAGSGAAAVDAMRTLGVRGLAVTTPHKADVAAAVDEVDPAAAALRSVNTVVLRDDGTTFGASTDGAGFVGRSAPSRPACSQRWAAWAAVTTSPPLTWS
jgi:hypothetical protein